MVGYVNINLLGINTLYDVNVQKRKKGTMLMLNQPFVCHNFYPKVNHKKLNTQNQEIKLRYQKKMLNYVEVLLENSYQPLPQNILYHFYTSYLNT